MAQFSYKARRRNGESIQGSLDVADRTAALAQLERQGLLPIQVLAAKGSKALDPSQSSLRLSPPSFPTPFGPSSIESASRSSRNWPPTRNSSPTFCGLACH